MSSEGLHGSTSGVMVCRQSRVTSSCPVRGSGSPLVGGATTYAVVGSAANGDVPRSSSELDCVPVKLASAASGDRGHENTASDVWNPRASMAFDSAKGLLNPVGENNCFLNSAVQVRGSLARRLCSIIWFSVYKKPLNKPML